MIAYWRWIGIGAGAVVLAGAVALVAAAEAANAIDHPGRPKGSRRYRGPPNP
jgi:hypothetical protein